MRIEILSRDKITKIKSRVQNLLDMYSPVVAIDQTNDYQVIWCEEQNGNVNEWNNIMCSVAISSSKGNFKKIMDFRPSLDEESIAMEIAKKFFDEKNGNINGPLANKLLE